MTDLTALYSIDVFTMMHTCPKQRYKQNIRESCHILLPSSISMQFIILFTIIARPRDKLCPHHKAEVIISATPIGNIIGWGKSRDMVKLYVYFK